MTSYQPYPIKIKATRRLDETKVIIQIFHHMQSGRLKNLKGNIIPQHYIQEVSVYHLDHLLINAYLNYTVAENPKWKFSFKGGKLGDQIRVIWHDNLGLTREDITTIQ